MKRREKTKTACHFPGFNKASISLSPSWDPTSEGRMVKGKTGFLRNMGHHNDPACSTRDVNNLGLAVL